jgi:hypothetical protein
MKKLMSSTVALVLLLVCSAAQAQMYTQTQADNMKIGAEDDGTMACNDIYNAQNNYDTQNARYAYYAGLDPNALGLSQTQRYQFIMVRSQDQTNLMNASGYLTTATGRYSSGLGFMTAGDTAYNAGDYTTAYNKYYNAGYSFYNADTSALASQAASAFAKGNLDTLKGLVGGSAP